MYLLLAHPYPWIAWHILSLIPFSTINNIPLSVNGSSFTLMLFEAACDANLGRDRTLKRIKPTYSKAQSESC